VNDRTPSTRLGPFDSSVDLPILEGWLERPHVARWWGDPKEAVSAILKHTVQSSAFIFNDNVPIGFICWQVPSPQELAEAGLADLPANIVDIDIMIGETGALGHGHGSEALSQLLARLSGEGVQIAGIATAAANERARKAFERAGFRMFKTFIDSGEKMLYLTKVLNAAA